MPFGKKGSGQVRQDPIRPKTTISRDQLLGYAIDTAIALVKLLCAYVVAKFLVDYVFQPIMVLSLISLIGAPITIVLVYGGAAIIVLACVVLAVCWIAPARDRKGFVRNVLISIFLLFLVPSVPNAFWWIRGQILMAGDIPAPPSKLAFSSVLFHEVGPHGVASPIEDSGEGCGSLCLVALLEGKLKRVMFSHSQTPDELKAQLFGYEFTKADRCPRPPIDFDAKRVNGVWTYRINDRHPDSALQWQVVHLANRGICLQERRFGVQDVEAIVRFEWLRRGPYFDRRKPLALFRDHGMAARLEVLQADDGAFKTIYRNTGVSWMPWLVPFWPTYDWPRSFGYFELVVKENEHMMVATDAFPEPDRNADATRRYVFKWLRETAASRVAPDEVDAAPISEN